MSQKKGMGVSFIIPRPVDEVKQFFSDYDESNFMLYTKIALKKSPDNENEWYITIRQANKVMFRSSLQYNVPVRFSGLIRYHTVDTTELEGQVKIYEGYEDHLVTNILMRGLSILLVLGFIIGLLFLLLPIHPAVLTFLSVGLIVGTFVVIHPYLVQQSRASAHEADYNDNESILRILRELAPDDVII